MVGPWMLCVIGWGLSGRYHGWPMDALLCQTQFCVLAKLPHSTPPPPGRPSVQVRVCRQGQGFQGLTTPKTWDLLPLPTTTTTATATATSTATAIPTTTTPPPTTTSTIATAAAGRGVVVVVVVVVAGPRRTEEQEYCCCCWWWWWWWWVLVLVLVPALTATATDATTTTTTTTIPGLRSVDAIASHFAEWT